jgi:hypothetical protein
MVNSLEQRICAAYILRWFTKKTKLITYLIAMQKVGVLLRLRNEKIFMKIWLIINLL